MLKREVKFESVLPVCCFWLLLINFKSVTEENENNGTYTDNSNGKFLPGNPGKPKGAMMKSTTKIKKALVDFLEYNMESVQDSFERLKPIEKLQFITSVLPYVIPKQQSIQSELKGEIDHKIDKITVEIVKAANGSMESNTGVQ